MKDEFNICIIKPSSKSVIQEYSYKAIKEYIDTSRIIPVDNCGKIEKLAFKMIIIK